MAHTTIEQILGVENMLGIIEKTKGGLPNNLPTAFFSNTKPIKGNTGTYTKVDGTRTTAQLVQYGAGSERDELVGVSKQPVSLVHTFRHILHDQLVLQYLSNYDNPGEQRLGEVEISRQTGEFMRKFQNLRLSAIAMMLAKGAIYFGSSGEIQATDSGATTTVDFSIPAANQDQLGGIIGASWATAATDIVGDIKAIKKQAAQTSGYQLKYAFYGSNILGYFLTNTAIGDLVAGNPAYAQSFMKLEIPDGFLGLTWIPVDEMYYATSAGSNVSFFGADQITFIPEPTRDVYELLEGSYLVPTSLGNISANAVEASRNVRSVNGMFSYAQINDDPVTVKHLAGDTFLPVWKVPSAMFIADVTP